MYSPAADLLPHSRAPNTGCGTGGANGLEWTGGGDGSRPHRADHGSSAPKRGVSGTGGAGVGAAVGAAAAFVYDVVALDRSAEGPDVCPRALRLTRSRHPEMPGAAPALEFLIWIDPNYDYESIPNHIWALLKLGQIVCRAQVQHVRYEKEPRKDKHRPLTPPLTVDFHLHADLDALSRPTVGPGVTVHPESDHAPRGGRVRLHHLLHLAQAHAAERTDGRSRRTMEWRCRWGLGARYNGNVGNRVTQCDHVGVGARYGAVNPTGNAMLRWWISSGVPLSVSLKKVVQILGANAMHRAQGSGNAVWCIALLSLPASNRLSLPKGFTALYERC